MDAVSLSAVPGTPPRTATATRAAAGGDRAIEGSGTAEADWLHWLERRRLPEAAPETLVPPGCRAVVVAPHPDDEVLSVGGLFGHLAGLRRELLVVAATDVLDANGVGTAWTLLQAVTVAGFAALQVWALRRR